uniref:Uncharacterized protein n=1 Tax=Acrobeloides nanus TaxID=290746 RepID=A0A914E8E5_9BILA
MDSTSKSDYEPIEEITEMGNSHISGASYEKIANGLATFQAFFIVVLFFNVWILFAVECVNEPNGINDRLFAEDLLKSLIMLCFLIALFTCTILVRAAKDYSTFAYLPCLIFLSLTVVLFSFFVYTTFTTRAFTQNFVEFCKLILFIGLTVYFTCMWYIMFRAFLFSWETKRFYKHNFGTKSLAARHVILQAVVALFLLACAFLKMIRFINQNNLAGLLHSLAGTILLWLIIFLSLVVIVGLLADTAIERDLCWMFLPYLIYIGVLNLLLILAPFLLYELSQAETLRPIMTTFQSTQFIVVIYVSIFSGLICTFGYFAWCWQLVFRVFIETYQEARSVQHRLLTKRKSFTGSYTEIENGDL